ncbi:putative extracellular serine-rich protein [Phaeoacremonium minimum UCRPA7]|uniref:Putative extracellular serine-rich protein n=1 Tax=Phaeoacremonium minimum (strain UCR-PA7) TaxID=1286976 RepID=R8BCP8_PHAM7|nr:putative extracellular serine-rich protein [Phaeoacremonium minimum UCRPA7]EON97065.1 putative extracellular serine-rich protein [Phaeoacremonium minimum UCRPA7]
MFTVKTLTAIVLAAASVSAAPTATTRSYPDQTVTLTGTTHSVVAGLGGLRFDPDNVVAEVGDIVEWHFLPKNHSVAQSSFAAPCVPQENAFFSGFQPTPEGQAPDVFQIVVKDKAPIWYYCAQTVGSHCKSGMVGVINQNFDGPNTLDAHKALAANTNVTIIPPVSAGLNDGNVLPNPNPQGGF